MSNTGSEKAARAIEALKIAIEALQQEAVVDESVEFTLTLHRESEIDPENSTFDFQAFKAGRYVNYSLDLRFTTKPVGR